MTKWVKTYAGGKPNYTDPIEGKIMTEDDIADYAYESGFAMGPTKDRVVGDYDVLMRFARLVLENHGYKP